MVCAFVGKPVDMWSLGVVLFMLLGGYPPFYEPDDDQKTMFRKIVNCEYQFHPENWEDVSEEAKDLIRGLLELDVKKRLTVDQALDHPWMNVSMDALVAVDLNKNMQIMRTFRAHRAAAVLSGATIAIDAVRKLSGANINKAGGVKLNDVAIDVVRKLSGANLNLNDAVIEAARKRSGASLASLSTKMDNASTKKSPNATKKS